MILLLDPGWFKAFHVPIAISIGPPLVLALIGLIIQKKKPETANQLFGFAIVYLIIGAGICMHRL